MNLLDETLNVIKENDKTTADVRWVGRASINAKCSWDDFAKQADFEYNNGYGCSEIPEDLVVVGDDWWLERAEYDGSEWWEFKTLPVEPKASGSCYDRDLGLSPDAMCIPDEWPNDIYEVLKMEEWSKAEQVERLERYMCGATEPAVHDFCVRAPVHKGIQPLVSIIGEQKSFILDFEGGDVAFRRRFDGAIKKIEAITGNVARISVEALSVIETKKITRR